MRQRSPEGSQRIGTDKGCRNGKSCTFRQNCRMDEERCKADSGPKGRIPLSPGSYG